LPVKRRKQDFFLFWVNKNIIFVPNCVFWSQWYTSKVQATSYYAFWKKRLNIRINVTWSTFFRLFLLKKNCVCKNGLKYKKMMWKWTKLPWSCYLVHYCILCRVKKSGQVTLNFFVIVRGWFSYKMKENDKNNLDFFYTQLFKNVTWSTFAYLVPFLEWKSFFFNL